MPSFSSEERRLLNDSLSEFLADKYTFDHFRKLTRAEDGEGFDRALWSEYANLGWLGVALPESAGGAGGGATELAIVMAGVGRHLLLEPFLSTIVLGARTIELAGSTGQQELLQSVADGSHLLAFCHAEPDSGYARDWVQTVARRDGGGWVLDGAKGFQLHAHVADTLVVSARVGGATGPVNLFLVPRTAVGITLIPAPSLDGRRGAALTLAGVQVGADALLGGSEKNQMPVVERVLDRGAISVSAEAVGAMAAVSQMTLDYLKTRQQFGQPLSRFQVLQHRLVDMNVSTEEARATVHAGLQALDDGAPDARRAVWHAKVQAARSGRFVGAQGIQLHGGMGMTDELVIGHFYKRICQCESAFGDAEWYLGQIAQGRDAA